MLGLISDKLPTTFILFPLFLVLLVACTAGGGSGAQSDTGDTEDEETEEVTLALSWLPSPEAAGWYSARENGWFEEQDLEVEIARGFGSGDTAQRVATGEAEFGIVDVSGLVPMRLNEDLPVLAIAALFAEAFHGVSFRAETGIEEPRDLEGRSIACSAGNSNMLMFPAFAEATGIDAGTIDWKLSEPSSIDTVFLGGETEAACHPVMAKPRMQARSDEEVGHFSFFDYGVSTQSQMLVTAESTIEERPDLVERFTRAALRGLEFSVEHPEDAIDILLSREPDLDPDLTHAAWEITLDGGLMTNEDTERNGIGYISAEKMQAAFDTLVESSRLDPGNYTAEDLYTSEFLP